MNERCREALYHSWGKAPERKKLEKEYNRSYYQKNKQKWGVKSASEFSRSKKKDDFVGPQQPTTITDHALNAVGYGMMLVPGASYLYGSPQEYASYIKEDVSLAKKFVKKLAKFGSDTVEVSKAAIEAGKKFVNSLNFVKKWKDFWKEGQEYMNEYY